MTIAACTFRCGSRQQAGAPTHQRTAYDTQLIVANGDEIVFLSDPSPAADQFFNYDVFAVKLSDGSIRRITATETTEYTRDGLPMER